MINTLELQSREEGEVKWAREEGRPEWDSTAASSLAGSFVELEN